ncbi:MAG: hypothetical protein HDS26_03360 [Bacteroides sp.]|nr:hypothetical protein [Bacteroides sp.]
MIRYWNNKERMESAVNRYMGNRKNRPLVWTARGFCILTIILLFIMIIWSDIISDRTILLLRGCTGASAIIFLLLISIILYRAYSSLWNTRK